MQSRKVRDDGSSDPRRGGAVGAPPLWVAAILLAEMLGVVVYGLVTSAQSVHQLSSESQVRAAKVDTDRYSCLESAMRARIPTGALVFNDGADDLQVQRIAEELTPGYRFVKEPVPGSYTVRFTRPGPCFVIGVDVTRVAQP